MGLLSLAIWTPIAFGVVLLALGRDEQAGAVEGIRAWRLRAIPERSQQAAETNDSHKAASNDGQSAVSSDGLLAVELEQISTEQLQVYLRAEQEE